MNLAQIILVAFLRGYRVFVSPAKTVLFGTLGQCRFHPTCSAYALQAVTRFGALHGSWLALKRLGRCHPWGDCGNDPVPSHTHRCWAQSDPPPISGTAAQPNR